MAPGSTQPLVKMSTRNIIEGKGGRCSRLTTSPPSRAECHEIWEPKPPGSFWVTPGLLRDCCTFTEIPYLWVTTVCCFMGVVMYCDQQTQWKLRVPTQYTLYQMSNDTVSITRVSKSISFHGHGLLLRATSWSFMRKKKLKVKVKFTLKQAMKALNEIGDITLLLL